MSRHHQGVLGRAKLLPDKEEYMAGKIVLLASLKRMPSDDLLNGLKSAGLSIALVDSTGPVEQVAEQCKGAEIAILGWPPPSMELLRRIPTLKYIQLMSAGFDYLDVKALSEMGVRIANNSEAIKDSVAEHTILLMLAVYRDLVNSWRSLMHRRWDTEVKRWEFQQITGKTIGIVGLGHIGQEVARRLKTWRANIIYHDIRTFPKKLEEELGVTRVSLEELLRTSDIVTLHVPLNNRTRHMFSTREFSLMKPTAVLINTCRGPVVDEKALYDALAKRRIAAAGLDVFEEEPIQPDNPLMELNNVVLTPHTAGGSMETTRNITQFTVENVKRMATGQEPRSLILIQD